ncbi:FadR/GntR family transcriptional regulator [Shewanella psychrotolerans]|uniref:FadR/GntR family transcriptional regulator n=1 Tax=Shewanella psychrotolerans TaxID=2864206 RepID=UPI001C65F396|nr:FadR/GntR family transcriptional regulator [Shewanella psychrotolerans]QYK03037.1 FadR family transcriptional regulator [Shewanella psychrotolerans]
MANPVSTRPQNIHTWVAGELGSRIVSGYYAPGEYIPNEITICEELEVSRTSLREAFKVLTAKGLIESRPKLGTRIRERRFWNMFDPVILGWFSQSKPSPDFYTSLYEIRAVFEPAAAELAAKKRSPEQLEKIASCYYNMENAQLGTDEIYTTDIDFHMAILDGTNNEFMVSLGESIQSALLEIFRVSSNFADDFTSSLPGHKAIYTAIEASDSEAAKLAMHSLLSTSQETVNKNFDR